MSDCATHRVDCQHLPVWRWRVWLGAVTLVTSAAFAAEPDLARARELAAEGKHQAAYELLAPFATTAQRDVAFNLQFGAAALATQRADAARAAFEAALVADPASVEAHLGLGRAYLGLGNYARAKIEFETVLRFDDLPSGLEQQVEIYAREAEAYATGSRWLGSGYGILGYGNYRTGARGGGPDNDRFFAARVGGSVNYELADSYALDGSLDYRFRDYDADGRRNDSDLRWNGAVSRNVGEGNWVAGLRGRVSYRGDGNYRNDYGVYGNYRLRLDSDNQVSVGAEVRQRRYPNGPLRDRTRNIFELSGSWTTSFLEGNGSFTLAGQAGREFNTERNDGDANFFGLSPSVSYVFSDTVSAFGFFWWQNDRYNIERLGSPGDGLVGIGTRNDNLYEVGGGLTWQFLPRWSLNPEVLYIRDQSNILAVNYSSTELWITLRYDF